MKKILLTTALLLASFGVNATMVNLEFSNDWTAQFNDDGYSYVDGYYVYDNWDVGDGDDTTVTSPENPLDEKFKSTGFQIHRTGMLNAYEMSYDRSGHAYNQLYGDGMGFNGSNLDNFLDSLINNRVFHSVTFNHGTIVKRYLISLQSWNYVRPQVSALRNSVPEPASIVLMLTGLLGMLGMKRFAK